MQNRRRPARQEKAGRIVLVALGAIAGLAMGMALADRLGGLEGLKRAPSPRRHRKNGWRTDLSRSESFDELPDDHSELAPEAISHLHLAEQFADQVPRRAESRAGSRASRSAAAAAASRAAAQSDAPSLEELEVRVLEAFENDPMLAHRAIDIGALAPGEVELTGWVAEQAEIDYAMTIARGVPGVEHVRNSLAANTDAVD